MVPPKLVEIIVAFLWRLCGEKAASVALSARFVSFRFFSFAFRCVLCALLVDNGLYCQIGSINFRLTFVRGSMQKQ